MEVIVVDNGSVDGSAELLHRQQKNFRLIPLYESIAGKSRSLNLALTQLSGKLVLFTDDDVSFEQDWVENYVRASNRFAQCAMFCGPIVPDFPSSTPQWLRTHRWNDAFFGTFSLQAPEGPLPDELVPFGANVAVRSDAIVGMQFRMDLGPSESNGMLLGEDVEFARQVRNKWHECVYVPSAPVRHHVRPEQITPAWLYDRAFAFGRSIIALKRPVSIVPNFEPSELAVDEEGQYLEQGCLIHYYCGQLAACAPTCRVEITELTKALDALDIGRYRPVLTRHADAVCRIFLSS
jgi:glycosyltransferase involved in cell wall biosynthesis